MRLGATALALLTLQASGPRCGPALRTDDASLAYLGAVALGTADAFVVRSPDGRLLARTDSLDFAESLVVVVVPGGTAPVPVVAIGESDPGSGLSHALAWTRDSEALVIVGRGAINGGPVGPLCLVYRVRRNDLLAPRTCPATR